MNTERHLLFPPFRLDPVNQRLWREGQEIPLRQKTFAVLRYLLEHPDQPVTKAALLDALWPGVYVNDIAPGVCIQELRRALGDERKTPRFIATAAAVFQSSPASASHCAFASFPFVTSSTAKS